VKTCCKLLLLLLFGPGMRETISWRPLSFFLARMSCATSSLRSFSS